MVDRRPMPLNDFEMPTRSLQSSGGRLRIAKDRGLFDRIEAVLSIVAGPIAILFILRYARKGIIA